MRTERTGTSLVQRRPLVWAAAGSGSGLAIVDIVAEDVPDGVSAEDHAAGLSSSLANLAGYVEQ